MKLVLAEKPSVAMSLSKVIGANQRGDGYMEGNGYLVSWCVGHLVELSQPEAYDEKYAKWRYEKKKFDSRWKRLEVEYCDAGMSEEQIAAMKEYDWAWFCSQRVFQNHTQPIPCEQYDEVCGQSQLFRKFASLSYQWDVDKIDQTRYGWLASVENEQLLLRLKKLSKKDLELLTLLFVDGYGLTAPKKRNPKSSAKNPGDSANGKEKEIDEG